MLVLVACAHHATVTRSYELPPLSVPESAPILLRQEGPFRYACFYVSPTIRSSFREEITASFELVR